MMIIFHHHVLAVTRIRIIEGNTMLRNIGFKTPRRRISSSTTADRITGLAARCPHNERGTHNRSKSIGRPPYSSATADARPRDNGVQSPHQPIDLIDGKRILTQKGGRTIVANPAAHKAPISIHPFVNHSSTGQKRHVSLQMHINITNPSPL